MVWDRELLMDTIPLVLDESRFISKGVSMRLAYRINSTFWGLSVGQLSIFYRIH